MNITPQTIQTMLRRLGFRLTGPLLEERVRTALEFFARRMPTLAEDTRFGFLRGMDLHKPLEVQWLPDGARVAAFRLADEPLLKLFYTKPGTSPYHLGIVPGGRRFQRFRLRQPCEVLISRAADFVYASANAAATGQRSWARPGGGGGLQYIIPHADRFLEVLNSTEATERTRR
jgi:hypothetical protein